MTVLGKLRKFGLNKLLAAVIAFSLLCVPFSVLADATPVTSPMYEPQPVTTGLERKYFFVAQRSDYTRLWEYDMTFVSEPSEVFFRTAYGGGGYGCLPCSNVDFSLTLSSYDVATGSLLTSSSNFTTRLGYAEIPNTYYTCANSGLLYDVYKRDLNLGFYSIPSDITRIIRIVDPFVTWAVDVPEQTQYKSVLAEPVADTHNRYFIANDKLYWISFYLDNLWVNPVTGSQTSSTTDETAVITGTASDPTDGDLYYNYNMSVTYQDTEYYILQYSSIDYSFEDMCAPCLIYNSSGVRLAFSFDQLSSIYSSIQDILVDYRIYCSSFDLITGEYIESVYSANGQVGSNDISINISFDDELADVLCYGVNFVNTQNLPVNLASVLWSYDYVFETWRTDMYVKLAGIYNLLAQSETPTTTTPADYASMLNDPSALDGYNAEDAGPLLSEAASKAQVQIGDGMAWGSEQIQSIFGIAPEMYLVVIIALAFGLAVLILGKKKSDN